MGRKNCGRMKNCGMEELWDENCGMKNWGMNNCGMEKLWDEDLWFEELWDGWNNCENCGMGGIIVG